MLEKVGACDSRAQAAQVAPAIEKVGQELPVRKWQFLLGGYVQTVKNGPLVNSLQSTQSDRHAL
jgi:hypothetical protein